MIPEVNFFLFHLLSLRQLAVDRCRDAGRSLLRGMVVKYFEIDASTLNPFKLNVIINWS